MENYFSALFCFQLAKDIVFHGDNQLEVQKLYDSYLENKSDTIKEAFINNYMHEKYGCGFFSDETLE